MVRTNLDGSTDALTQGRTHIHRTKIVTTMSRLPASGLDKNNAGETSMSEDSKQKAWFEHYQRLFNAEFDWDLNHLSDESPVEGPPIPITIDMIKKISIFHGCTVWIEKSVTRVTDRHHKAC